LFIVHSGLVAAYVAMWLQCAAQGLFWRADFISFYTGAAMVLEGRSECLYDLDAQTVCQQRVIPPRRGVEGLLAYVNPPHVAPLLAPLALVPWEKAFVVWTLLELALLVPLFLLLRRWTRDWGAGFVPLAFVTTLAFPPMWLTFQQGQWSLLGLVCLLGFYDGLKRGRLWVTAGWFVLGTIKPQLMIVPAMTLIAGRRWRILSLAAALLVAWCLAATALLGWSCWPAFLAMLHHCAYQFGTYGIDPLRMYNTKCALTALLGAGQPGLINGLTTVGTVGCAVLTLWVWRGPWRSESPGFETRSALTLLVGTLTNPYCNPADVLTLVAPMVFLCSAYRTERSWPALAVLAAAAPLCFLADFFLVPFGAGIARPFLLFVLVWAAWAARCWARSSRTPELANMALVDLGRIRGSRELLT
jgi:hypothetical protein